jgi:hypothetical protein
MGEMTKAYNILVGKPKGKRKPHERPRHRWEGMDWIQLAQNMVK